jgi:hypothetical protein
MAAGWYLPKYNWSVARFPGTPNWCLCVRRSNDQIATDPMIVSAIEEWAQTIGTRHTAKGGRL